MLLALDAHTHNTIRWANEKPIKPTSTQRWVDYVLIWQNQNIENIVKMLNFIRHCKTDFPKPSKKGNTKRISKKEQDSSQITLQSIAIPLS